MLRPKHSVFWFLSLLVLPPKQRLIQEILKLSKLRDILFFPTDILLWKTKSLLGKNLFILSGYKTKVFSWLLIITRSQEQSSKSNSNSILQTLLWTVTSVISKCLVVGFLCCWFFFSPTQSSIFYICCFGLFKIICFQGKFAPRRAMTITTLTVTVF